MNRFVKCLVTFEDLKQGCIYEVLDYFPSEQDTFDELEIGMSPGCAQIADMTLLGDNGIWDIYDVDDKYGYSRFCKSEGPATILKTPTITYDEELACLSATVDEIVASIERLKNYQAQ